MVSRRLVAAVLVSLSGCASATLPYEPVPQPAGARISAAYQIVGDRLKIEIDAGRRRLEEVKIVRADGTALHPQAIDDAPVVAPGPGLGVGVGVGGGSFGGRGGVGVGTGVSIGIPIGGGVGTPEGNTYAWFPIDQAGPPPWNLHVKLAGIEPVVIVVGGPGSPTR